MVISPCRSTASATGRGSLCDLVVTWAMARRGRTSRQTTIAHRGAVTDRRTGISDSYGWILFEEAESSNAAAQPRSNLRPPNGPNGWNRWSVPLVTFRRNGSPAVASFSLVLRFSYRKVSEGFRTQGVSL